mmetsp:Transcript_20428/g.62171  ORF Transcript_20428/g.62171 Transcript_20428/m.62171 type:complete len:231 (-) Transcript_20428:1196-1888(-)
MARTSRSVPCPASPRFSASAYLLLIMPNCFTGSAVWCVTPMKYTSVSVSADSDIRDPPEFIRRNRAMVLSLGVPLFSSLASRALLLAGDPLLWLRLLAPSVAPRRRTKPRRPPTRRRSPRSAGWQCLRSPAARSRRSAEGRNDPWHLHPRARCRRSSSGTCTSAPCPRTPAGARRSCALSALSWARCHPGLRTAPRDESLPGAECPPCCDRASPLRPGSPGSPPSRCRGS